MQVGKTVAKIISRTLIGIGFTLAVGAATFSATPNLPSIVTEEALLLSFMFTTGGTLAGHPVFDNPARVWLRIMVVQFTAGVFAIVGTYLNFFGLNPVPVQVAYGVLYMLVGVIMPMVWVLGENRGWKTKRTQSRKIKNRPARLGKQIRHLSPDKNLNPVRVSATSQPAARNSGAASYTPRRLRKSKTGR